MTGAPAPAEPYRRLATLLDAQFRIPGTPFRYGWDAVLGLVPGLGDAAGGLLGAYGILTAYQLGAPPAVLLRLLLNLGLDLVLGSVPLLGDLLDVAWKGNLRNVALLERWLDRPEQTRRRSTGLFGLILVALLLLILIACYAAFRLAGWALGAAGALQG
jgi:hypothetical protein